MLKIDGALLKGVDSAGNKYWEKMQDQHGTKETNSSSLVCTNFSRGVQKSLLIGSTMTVFGVDDGRETSMGGVCITCEL